MGSRFYRKNSRNRFIRLNLRVVYKKKSESFQKRSKVQKLDFPKNNSFIAAKNVVATLAERFPKPSLSIDQINFRIFRVVFQRSQKISKKISINRKAFFSENHSFICEKHFRLYSSIFEKSSKNLFVKNRSRLYSTFSHKLLSQLRAKTQITEGSF